MKKIIMILAATSCVALACAQSVTPATSVDTVSTGSFKHPVISEVLSQRILVFTDIAGIKGTYIDWRGFGGFAVTLHNAPAAGTELIGYVTAAKQLTLGLGPVGEMIQQGKTIWGLAINARFTPSKTGAFDFALTPSPHGMAERLTYGLRF